AKCGESRTADADCSNGARSGPHVHLAATGNVDRTEAEGEDGRQDDAGGGGSSSHAEQAIWSDKGVGEENGRTRSDVGDARATLADRQVAAGPSCIVEVHLAH